MTDLTDLTDLNVVAGLPYTKAGVPESVCLLTWREPHDYRIRKSKSLHGLLYAQRDWLRSGPYTVQRVITGTGSLHHRTWILRRFAVFFDVDCQLLQFPESGSIYQKPCVSLYKLIFCYLNAVVI